MPLRTALAALLVLAVAGCGDPTRLVPGEPCVATTEPDTDNPHRIVGIYIPAFDPRIYRHMLEDDYHTAKYPHLHAGDRVRVVKDEGGDPTRLVEVKIETGEVAGNFGSMHWSDLRPIGGGK